MQPTLPKTSTQLSNSPTDHKKISEMSSPEEQMNLEPDYYLNALLWFCKNDKIKFSSLQSFSQRSSNEALEPGQFTKEATHLGYCVTTYDLAPTKIPSEHFPALLHLKDRQACLLVGKKTTKAQIILLGHRFESKLINFDKLNEFYAGSYSYCEKPVTYDSRVEQEHLQSEQHWFWSILKQSYPIYSEVFVASIFINIFAVIGSIFAMNIYDRVIPNQAMVTLYTLGLGMIVMHLFDLTFKSLRSYFLDMTNKKTDVQLNSLIFNHLSHISLKHKPQSVGGFSSLMGQFESFREFFNSASMATFIDLPFCLLFLAVIYSLGGSLVLVPIIALPLIALSGLITSYLCYDLNKQSMKISSEKQTLLIEYLAAIEGIKYWGAQRQVGEKWDQTITESASIFGKIKFRQSFHSHLCAAIQAISYIFLIGYGVHLIVEQQMTMGALIGSSILFSRALAPMVNLGQLMVRWQNAMTSLKGMDNVLQMPRENDGKDLVADHVQGHFEFHQVSLSYGQEKEEKVALKNIDLTIKPGEKVGIIGANGSGKTSLVKMLLGLFDAQEGILTLDGLDIRQYNPGSLRALIGYIPQDIHLLAGTLRDNITMGYPHIGDEQVLSACEKAGLKELIGMSEEGLNQKISERGFSLSGGQRQSLALARALLLNPKILIFDEPTSALDSQSELSFLQTLQQVSEKKTLIIISHRQAPLHLTQRIIVLNKGSIVGDQKTSDLLSGSITPPQHQANQATQANQASIKDLKSLNSFQNKAMNSALLAVSEKSNESQELKSSLKKSTLSLKNHQVFQTQESIDNTSRKSSSLKSHSSPQEVDNKNKKEDSHE